MKRGSTMIAVALLAAAGCTHTKTVANGQDEHREQRAERGSASERSQRHARHEAKEEPAADGNRAREDGRKEIPIATSPAGLLKPGAEKQIDDRLAHRGLLERRGDDQSGATSSRSEALRRFQKDNDLPATGMPDQETIRKLGLDPNDVFKAGDVSPTDGDARKRP